MDKGNILICPLEWGLGHASRCIPIARELEKRGYHVIFAAGDRHLTFLKYEFPTAEFLPFPGFNPTYSKFLPMWLAMALKSPLLVYHIVKEHRQLNKIVADNKIDLVVSDNRFGLWTNKAKTIYITHQLRIRFPKWTFFLEPLGATIHRWLIRRYDYCFVPDFPGSPNLSGLLSHSPKTPKNVIFIGPLSRFSGYVAPQQLPPIQQPLPSAQHPLPPNENPLQVLLILSGPEPQKSIFRRKVELAAQQAGLPMVILGAEPDRTATVDGNEPSSTQTYSNIQFYPHLPAEEMIRLITGSELIVTRPGYTSIMELVSLRRTALLVPTPGQTEQEYLAKTLSDKGWFTTIEQKNIGPEMFNQKSTQELPEELTAPNNDLLEKALTEVLQG